MNAMIAAVGLAVMLLLSAQSKAAFSNESGLLQKSESDSAADYISCAGYIVAISDFQDMLLVWSCLDEPLFCKPDSASPIFCT